MSKLFVALALGMLLRKTDFLDEHTNEKLSAVLVNVTLPLLVVNSVVGMTMEAEPLQEFFS